MQKTYDVVVIGAGSGGLTAAVGCNKVGLSVLLIEREHMGGECTNSGCIPSKALLHHAKTYHQAVSLGGETKATTAYRDEAFTYVRSKIKEIRDHEKPVAFEAMGIDVVMGEAAFTSPQSVSVAGKRYEFKKAIIATGSSPRSLSVPGLEKLKTSDVLTNQNVFNQKTIPERLLIIGSGPIGLELGQAHAMLGSHVTIATIDHELGRLEDPALRPYIAISFEQLGVQIETYAHLREITGQEAHFDRKDGDTVIDTFSVQFDKILIAIGRVPNLPKGLEKAGVVSSVHGIAVDSQYRTANTRIFAVGDVAQRLKFTHTADDTARQVVARIASRGLARITSQKAVPKVTYLEPEVAQVGLSHEAAVAKYSAARIHRIEVPLSALDRARTDETTAGMAVVIAKRLTGQVLGAHILAPRAGELITPFVLAIDNKLSLYKLRNTIYAYPTYSLLTKKVGDLFLATQIGSLKGDLVNLLKRNLPKVAVAAAWAFLVWSLYRYQTNHGMDTTDTALMIFDFVTMTAWGPFLYILFYAIRPVTFFPATALTILSGIFFGLVYGTVLTIIGAGLAASVAYLVGRFFGHGVRFEDSRFGSWVVALRDNTFTAILTMRLVFLPFDGVSYLAGILKVPYVSFIIATVLGILLGSATFVSIGASLDIEEFRMDGLTFNALEPQFLILSGTIFVLSLILSKLVSQWHTKSNAKKDTA